MHEYYCSKVKWVSSQINAILFTEFKSWCKSLFYDQVFVFQMFYLIFRLMYEGPKLFNIYLFQWTTCYDFLKILFIMYLYINDKFLLFMMDILFSSVIYFLTFVNNKYEVWLHGFPFELRQLMSESQTFVVYFLYNLFLWTIQNIKYILAILSNQEHEDLMNFGCS